MPSPQSLAIGAVRASVLFVLSAPGDSKVRPGWNTWAPGYLCESSDKASVLGEAAGSAVRGGWKGNVSAAHIFCVRRIFGCLYEERARVDNKEKPQFVSLVVADCSPISPETKDRRGWLFQHFKALLPVAVLGAGEGAVPTPLKAYSQDADVIPQHNIDEKRAQRRRRKRRKRQFLR